MRTTKAVSDWADPLPPLMPAQAGIQLVVPAWVPASAGTSGLLKQIHFSGNCSSPIGGQDDEAGFTLVEVIATFAILALALSVLMSAISDGLRRSARSEMEAAAGALAQSLLAKAGTEMALGTGARDGQQDGLLWRLQMAPFGDSSEQQHWPVGAYLVTAEVHWRGTSGDRSLTVSTLRIGPKEQAR